MRIVFWQTILMKYHSLFLSKIGKDVVAAVVIGALRVKKELQTTKRQVKITQHARICCHNFEGQG